ncbi:MAG: cytochrome c oxidase subunit II [Ignavibacteria bacterium]|nr:cytochrome c oxidase subunit II [Ignavibacteria bacterium]
MFSGGSNFIKDVDGVFLFILAVSVLLLVLITFLMILFVIKYNRKKHPTPKNIHGNIPLEILWTVIPTILVLGMFYYGWVGYTKMQDVPKDAMVIHVVARMWDWDFTYPNGVKTDTLYVPVNKAIKTELESADVNHSFYIPAFRVKKDVIPNKKNYMWFIADQVGSYDIACAEYCGLKHSYMYTKVVVMPEMDFDNWLIATAKIQQNTDSIKTVVPK